MAVEPLDGRLSCPFCRRDLIREDRSFVCREGHAFDIAKQGYVNLVGSGGGVHTADTKEMLAARHRVLEAGLFEPVTLEVSTILREAGLEREEGLVADIGCGTGYYLDRVLETLPGMTGIGLDNSKVAVRQAARRHPRAGAVVADVWDYVPIRDGLVRVTLNLFAPRNAGEMVRITAVGGLIVVITAGEGHLAELIERFSMISVDPSKGERLERSFGHLDSLVRERTVSWKMDLFRSEVGDIVAMGPSSNRMDPAERETILASLADRSEVTGQVSVSVFRAP